MLCQTWDVCFKVEQLTACVGAHECGSLSFPDVTNQVWVGCEAELTGCVKVEVVKGVATCGGMDDLWIKFLVLKCS